MLTIVHPALRALCETGALALIKINQSLHFLSMLIAKKKEATTFDQQGFKRDPTKAGIEPGSNTMLYYTGVLSLSVIHDTFSILRV